jgi:sugar/nucleoside kinase (ribokinase family)
MYQTSHLDPIDYLIIGHITTDLTPDGLRLGGTAAYAGLTARALGLKVGIVTSWGSELPLGELDQIPIVNLAAEKSTTFENIPTPEGRIQIIHSLAHKLDRNLIPETWMSAPIVHLGPVAQEVEPNIVRHFPNSLIGMTPQGWMREWNPDGHVRCCEWPEATYVIGQAGAAVISYEDVSGDESRIEELATYCRILAVTEAARGSRLYWNGDVRRFPAPVIQEVDAVGAGDIFGAAFFYRLYTTRDPWEAARFATQLASLSVARPGLQGIPTPDEVSVSLYEVL